MFLVLLLIPLTIATLWCGVAYVRIALHTDNH